MKKKFSGGTAVYTQILKICMFGSVKNWNCPYKIIVFALRPTTSPGCTPTSHPESSGEGSSLPVTWGHAWYQINRWMHFHLVLGFLIMCIVICHPQFCFVMSYLTLSPSSSIVKTAFPLAVWTLPESVSISSSTVHQSPNSLQTQAPCSHSPSWPCALCMGQRTEKRRISHCSQTKQAFRLIMTYLGGCVPSL